MDSSIDGESLLKRSKMNIAEKRQLVHQLSKNSHRAFRVLQDWTRQDILHILSAELGKEIKYSGLTKARIINKLLKIVSEKQNSEQDNEVSSPTEGNTDQKEKKIVSDENCGDQEKKKRDSSTTKINSKRRRKNANPSRYVAPTTKVNRLFSAPEVKNHCSSAFKSLEDTPLDDLALPSKMQGSTKIRFENVNATSLTLILCSEEESSSLGNITHYIVWHRKVSEKDYPNDSTCALFSPNTRFVVSGLSPGTEYCFKIVSFSGAKEMSVDETKVSTKTSQEEEEEATFVDCLSTKEEVEKQLALKDAVPENAVNRENSACCRFELEHCVKIIRQLEVSGYVEKIFRQKFLTWYSLRATAQEINVVKTFIDIFKDDSIALAEQLVDTFSDCILRKRSAIGGRNGGGGSGASAVVSAGFGNKSRH